MPDVLKRPEGNIVDALVIVKGMAEMYRRAAKNGIDERSRGLAAKRADALEMALYAMQRVDVEDWIRAEKAWIAEMEKQLEG